MILAHDVVAVPNGQPDSARTVVFLHGILGSRNNWKSFAKRVVDAVPGWRAVIVDLRNHGNSHGPGFARPHTIQACADDVRALIAELSAREDKPPRRPGVRSRPQRSSSRGEDVVVVVGHSFGGKVALQLAARAERGTEPPPHGGKTSSAPRAIWSLDCPPGTRAFAGSDIGRVLDAIRSVPLPVESRKALVEILRGKGLSDALSQWMTTNLRPAENGAGFTWKFDLDAVDDMLASFGALDLWPVVEDRSARDPAVQELVIVRGSRSDRFSPDDVSRVQRAVARGDVVEHVVDAGHWLHTDNPDALAALLIPALQRISS